ncbi:tryptophan synthase subunit alpha [Paenibacillus pasadenensis]|uniref:tryptophan synthase subunit alpha n=1 Tax=Paenibacillus pasadenensis TaxID=217090 RepID=UPI002040242E|nr:tryptophan synthase subunit alpha [Paenibacillus pasadenensis]MCM3747417.1 tryptophan synthase subunit alpha [Paenibacillus pasadenensis]
MNLIDEVFQKLKSEGRTALIPFITTGDPDLKTTIDIVIELERSGADMIELGVPYSDPLADGPVIQKASERALRGPVTLEACVEVAAKSRAAGVKMPFILFSYFNPVLQYGLERFFTLIHEKGISGLIIPDLPIEEDAEVREMAAEAGIHLIPLVAPTSKTRVQRIAASAQGFVYCVSSLGVTGMRSEFHSGIEEFLQSVREATKLPIAVGFGVSSRDQVERLSRHADGVIVGSAIVRQVEEALPLLSEEATYREGIAQIGRFVSSLRI